MTAPGREDRCPACGSDEVQPYAIILGAAEIYGYQCQDCAVTWTVLQIRHPARRPARTLARARP